MGKAEELFLSLIPNRSLFEEDKISVYFSFNSPMERAIYILRASPNKEVRINPVVDSRVFLSYAYLLIEKGDYDEALKILDLGLTYNPVDTNLLFEKSSVFQTRKDIERLREITDLAYCYSYTPIALARVYRNYGYIFTELKDYDGAICAYLQSLVYEDNSMAYKELLYISEATGKTIPREEYLAMRRAVLEDRNVPIGPLEEILGLAFHCARMAEEDLELDYAVQYYMICYELTKDPFIKEQIDRIKTPTRAS